MLNTEAEQISHNPASTSPAFVPSPTFPWENHPHLKLSEADIAGTTPEKLELAIRMGKIFYDHTDPKRKRPTPTPSIW